MAVKDILQLGHPLLWEKSTPVDPAEMDVAVSIIDDLRDTLAAFRQDNGFGRGIAAPQIGILKRMIYIAMPSGEFSGALINPIIVDRSENSVELWDSCFSLPGLMVKVSRSAAVGVEYDDLAGHHHRLEAKDSLSELLQHEIDHLDGLLIIHRALSPRAFTTRQEYLRITSKA
jgi:peptide deformylase